MASGLIGSLHPNTLQFRVDLLQVRKGLIHILDYKPEASKVDAVSQLTTYALALASRTRLAVRDFKIMSFYPLHAVYSLR